MARAQSSRRKQCFVSNSSFLAQTRSMVLVLILVLILQCLSHGVCGTASAESYVEQYLNSPDLCPKGAGLGSNIIKYVSFIKEKIRLANFPNHTVIVKLSRDQERNTVSDYLNFNCIFEVTAPKDHGVMVTIRGMHMRHGPSAGSCLDRIKLTNGNKHSTQEICGDVSADDMDKYPLRLRGPRYFYDPKAQMDVSISTYKDVTNDLQGPVTLELVFTAYSACSQYALNARKSKSCSNHSNICIPAGLWCDGVINCGFNTEFGADEADCPAKPSDISRSMSFIIFLMTALGTLVIVIVIVLVICLCLGRLTPKTHVTVPVRGSSTASSNAVIHPSSNSGARLNRDNNSFGNPTAPPREQERAVVETLIFQDNLDISKTDDQPPSYYEVFPEASRRRD